MEDNNIQDSCCNSKYASIRQMDKLDEMLGRRFPFYPRTVIQAVHDGRTGASLEAILAQYNNIYVQYQGTAGRTRNIVPKEMRRKGIIISYVDMQGNAITEKCVNDAQRDNFHWGLDVNWVRVDELTLSGDISVSVKGTWVINGEDTGIAALGPKGDNGLTPWLKTIDNKLHFSYDNETWEVCSDYIAAYFRFQDNKFQISRDNKTWSDLSGEVTNSLSIKAYVTDKSQYLNPKQGDMIMVGPTYADDDTEHTKPIYHLNIYNAGGWVDHGPFQSINAGVVQELGNSETEVMSQKAVSEKISELALQGKILKNVTGIIQGEYNTGGDKVENNHNANILQMVDINSHEGDRYLCLGYASQNYRLWAFTDADGNVIEKSAQGLDESKSAVLLEAPSGAVKAIFSSYVAYPLTVSKNGMFTQILSNKSHLSRKRAAFCGDSIMIGQDNKESVKSLTYYISKKTNLKCTNWAKGGSVILYPFYTGNAYSIYWQLTQVDKNSDYIILQGGVNGVNLNDSSKPNYAPMGRITEGFDEELQLNTQIGCLEAICRYAITQFPGKKIGFIITYDISNYEYWRDKVVKFKEVLDKWGIPYLDWRHSGINLASYDIRAIYGVDTWSEYEEYSNKKTYKTDDKVIYQSKAYKANQDIDSPEEWDSSKWTLISSDRYDGWHCNSLAYQLLADKTIKWMESL